MLSHGLEWPTNIVDGRIQFVGAYPDRWGQPVVSLPTCINHATEMHSHPHPEEVASLHRAGPACDDDEECLALAFASLPASFVPHLKRQYPASQNTMSVEMANQAVMAQCGE